MIPINIDTILKHRCIEDERIEFKRSWNPIPVMHTICAFANDISNLCGGYIIIGIDDDGTIKGINKDSVDKINRELVDICNRIEPRCDVQTEYAEKEGKGVLAIWVPGGHERPYRCPIGNKGEKAYFIRKLSSTVKANHNEFKELAEISNNVPFDDRINRDAKIGDIEMYLVLRFLSRIDSTLYGNTANMSPIELYERINLVGGPSEDRRPLNIALLMFNEHPEDFFRYAYIDFVDKPDPTGEGMIEKRFRGPLDKQIEDCVLFIENYVISESVSKPDDRPQADRNYNYPIKAIEETISNAVFHKDYGAREPITITLLPDRIEITSIPGPFRSITDEDLAKCNLISKTTRNRRIGEFLKELELIEGRNTGVPLILSELEKNGSYRPKFETDGDRTYMTVTIYINPNYLRKKVEEIKTKPERRSSAETKMMIVNILSKGEMGVNRLSKELGYTNVSPRLRGMIASMIADGTLEYTENNMFSPKQKLRLRQRFHTP